MTAGPLGMAVALVLLSRVDEGSSYAGGVLPASRFSASVCR